MKTTDLDLIVVTKKGCTRANSMHSAMDVHYQTMPALPNTNQRRRWSRPVSG